jgi:glycerophosphoryl diester phosphodiesterase
MKKCLVIAHRGVSAFAPENTLPSLEMAIDNYCDGIEFDVQFTKDFVPVIIHDETIDRTSTGKGFVKDYTLKELKNYDFGSWYSSKFDGVKIPTLEEFLQVASNKNYKGLINIELKNDKIIYPAIEEKTIDLVKHYKFFDQVLISSFNHTSLEIAKQISPDIKIGLLYDKKSIPDISTLSRMGAYSANIHYTDFSVELHNILKEYNIKLFCYTVNSSHDMKTLISEGVDGFFTDNPDLSSQVAVDQFFIIR